MIKPLMIIIRALVETIANETSTFTVAHINNPSNVHKRQARMLLRTYPSAPSASGLNHQATAMPIARTDARLEREAFVVKNQMTGTEIKRVRNKPTIQP